jgi:hypothetical protein
MKKIIDVVLLVTIWVLCTNCNKKCVETQIAVLKFTQNELSINPYDGAEILTFKNSDGDSIVFPKGTRKTEVQVITKISSGDAMEYHNGCTGDYFNKDYNWMEKINEDYHSRFDINLKFLYSFEHPIMDKEIELFFYSWVNSQPGGDGFDGFYKFKVDTIYNELYPGDSIVSYYNVLAIGPKAFNNVYELCCENPDTRNKEWFSIAYYTIKEGLVGFKTNFGQTWYLDKISK